MDNNEHAWIKDALQRIETKVDGGFEKMNGRVRKLEVWKGYVLGVSAIIAVVISYILKH